MHSLCKGPSLDMDPSILPISSPHCTQLPSNRPPTWPTPRGDCRGEAEEAFSDDVEAAAAATGVAVGEAAEAAVVGGDAVAVGGLDSPNGFASLGEEAAAATPVGGVGDFASIVGLEAGATVAIS